jgi:Flp pilus assembly protein TadG
MQKNTNRRTRGGNAVIEVALMAPWIFFLFVGVLDFGFYAYAFISVENAARAAVLLTSQSKTSASDQQDACALVLVELQYAAYGRTLPTTCQADPLVVNATLLTNGGLDTKDAAQVEVRYTTIGMIPIPGVFAGSFVIDRVWQMKINAAADF